MKLQIAKKIIAAIGTDRQTAYTGGQVHRAFQRTERTKSVREAHDFFDATMRFLGPGGRAEVIKSWSPSEAFALLMRSDDWRGDPLALVKELR